jgi:Domain of unknown function (DUF4326)
MSAATRMPERTCVVNVRNGAPYTLYIGRANGRYRLRQSNWHNPFRMGPDGTHEDVLARYRVHVLSQAELLAQIGELRGDPGLLVRSPCPVGHRDPAHLPRSDPGSSR